MKLERRFHAEAKLELQTAANWYDDRERGLGEEFVELVEEAVGLILEWPRIAPVFPGWDRTPAVRTQAVARFPFRVLYYLTNTEVVIVAVAHNRRKPGYWTDRVSE